MKALTVQQPFASLLATGRKRFETRSWSTDYRGPLAIHAGKSDQRMDLLEGPTREVYAPPLRQEGVDPDDLEFGVVLAVAELLEVEPTEKRLDTVSATEQKLGNWRPGRYAWMLDVQYRLEPPVPARGRQRLWEWERPDES